MGKHQRVKIIVPTDLKQLQRVAGEDLWRGLPSYRLSMDNLDQAIEILGNPKLSEINTAMVDAYIRTIAPGLKNSTINRKMSSFRAVMKYAYDREWINRMPKFTPKKQEEVRDREFSPEEQEQLIATLPEEMALFVEALIHTGCRRSELLRAKPSDLHGNYLGIYKSKTGKTRKVPLSDRAREILSTRLPFKLTIPQINWQWKVAREKLGFKGDDRFVLHVCRHTNATRLLRGTGNLKLVQKMLGHSRIATTARYAHVDDEGLTEAVLKVFNHTDQGDAKPIVFNRTGNMGTVIEKAHEVDRLMEGTPR